MHGVFHIVVFFLSIHHSTLTEKMWRLSVSFLRGHSLICSSPTLSSVLWVLDFSMSLSDLWRRTHNYIRPLGFSVFKRCTSLSDMRLTHNIVQGDITGVDTGGITVLTLHRKALRAEGSSESGSNTHNIFIEMSNTWFQITKATSYL